MIVLIYMLLTLPVFENFKKAEVPLSENKKSIIMIDYASCHKCVIKINKHILGMKNRNFQYFTLSSSDRSVLDRKSEVKSRGKLLQPDQFLFCKDSKLFFDFLENKNLKAFPVLIVKNKTETKIYSYKEIFSGDEDANIKKILNELNK